ncbi:MAG: glucose-1-phosphate adenylyltransferase [Cyanobacteria bacterium J06560_5]
MKRVLSIILGGGAGSRLYPLTKYRAKPAVSLAGMYRLIDIPVSNCLNSDILKIYVLTQFNSASLNRHISKAYNFSTFSDGFVEVLAAQQTPDSPSWFEGTADAVRKYMWMFEEADVDEFIILSGDHLYHMDYSDYIIKHREMGADVTLSVVPIGYKTASSFGLMKVDDQNRVTEFSEKPKGEALEVMKVDTSSMGLSPEEAEEKPFIASMGIYVFKKQVLIDLLNKYPEMTDFGHEIIPASSRDYDVRTYLFKGYWEDIGTIEAFYDANIALTDQPNPAFSFFRQDAPIYTRSRYLPPSKILDSKITESIISEGCIIKNCRINKSVVGLRQRIHANCEIDHTLIIGNDYYEEMDKNGEFPKTDEIPMAIGEGSVIRRAIIDKNARIGKNVQIINKDNVQEAERESEGYYIRSGIVVVIKNAVIPDGTII